MSICTFRGEEQGAHLRADLLQLRLQRGHLERAHGHHERSQHAVREVDGAEAPRAPR